MYFALVAACLLSREPIRLIDNPICIGIGLALVTGFLAVNPTTPLVNRVVVWIGRVSFSMYLIHFAVLAAFAKTGLQALFVVGDWTSIAYCLCLLGVTSPLAHMCYQTIEQRGVRAGKKLIERLGRRDLRGDAPEQLI
jgi:peptidoglycan/LPS O-acetylase OafA/YrhL